ncbi:MAG: DUF4332 domain-containing protein [Gemmatimonadota bacterium]
MSTQVPFITQTRSGAAGQLPAGWWQLPLLAVAGGLALVAAATMLLLRGIEPFATWYYNFAWYPVLLAADGLVALTGGVNGRRGEFLLLGRKGFLITMLLWSAVVWLFYEAFNFRLENWYYINLPDSRLNRWTGTLVAFATVLPAVFVAEAVLNGFNVAKRVRWPRFTVDAAFIRTMRVAGIIMLALVLIWPRYFFPLVWGATMLLVEPENYRRSRAHSLLADLERGEPGRLLRLLLGGACIGFVWELLNINARAKWIYTVPGVEELKIFEMPVPGFFGFPPFAVECFILWQALLLAGFAMPRIGPAFPAATRTRVFAAVTAVLFSVGTLLGMEWLTVDSYGPRLSDIPGAPAAQLERAGYDAFSLAHASPQDVAGLARAELSDVRRWIDHARLVTLRGIGTEYVETLNRVGVHSVEQLAAQNPARLIAALEAARGEDLVDARVRVWIRGARRALEQQSLITN